MQLNIANAAKDKQGSKELYNLLAIRDESYLDRPLDKQGLDKLAAVVKANREKAIEKAR